MDRFDEFLPPSPQLSSSGDRWIQVETKEDKAERIRRAKELCESCPVFWPCLEYVGFARPEFGVWAGVNMEDRKERLAAWRRALRVRGGVHRDRHGNWKYLEKSS